MAENTSIEWADHTFNPWTGCTKVSHGCDGCFAESWAKRSGTVRWGVGEPRRRTTNANWRLPPKWNAQAEREGRRFRVFCASLADVFDNEVPQEWRDDLFRLIERTPRLDWLLLTKRVGNVAHQVGDVRFHDLRHSAASEMVNAGVPLYTVGQVLGHKDQRSTARYSHLLAETLGAAVSQIGRKRA